MRGWSMGYAVRRNALFRSGERRKNILCTSARSRAFFGVCQDIFLGYLFIFHAGKTYKYSYFDVLKADGCVGSYVEIPGWNSDPHRRGEHEHARVFQRILKRTSMPKPLSCLKTFGLRTWLSKKAYGLPQQGCTIHRWRSLSRHRLGH